MDQSITYNNYSLQDNTMISQIVGDEAWTDRLETYRVARAGIDKPVARFAQPKTIRVKGKIISTTASGLDGKISEVKQQLDTVNANLDIAYPITQNYIHPDVGLMTYSDTIRRFVAIPQNFTTQNQPYETLSVDYAIDFMIPTGTGESTVMDVSTVSGFTSDTWGIYGFVFGSAPAQTLTEFVFTNGGRVNRFEYYSRGRRISTTVIGTGYYVAGDKITIDNEHQRVFLNNTETTYSGTFPSWDIGPITTTDYDRINFYGDSLILDQKQTEANAGTSLFGGNYRAQSFVPSATAKCPQVDMFVRRLGAADLSLSSLVVQLANSSGGLPGSNISGTYTTFDPASISENGAWIPVVFSTAPTLTSGTTYFIKIYQGGNSGNMSHCYTLGRWHFGTSTPNVDKYPAGDEYDSADFGSTWSRADATGLDLMFKTYYSGAAFAHSGVLTLTTAIYNY